MSKLAKVKAYIEAGHRNKDICDMLDVAHAYVSTIRHRMRSGAYDDRREHDPKVADGEYFAHYEKIQRDKEAKQALNKYCVRLKVVNGKAMECGKPSHGRPYCADCRAELISSSRRHTPPATIKHNFEH